MKALTLQATLTGGSRFRIALCSSMIAMLLPCAAFQCPARAQVLVPGCISPILCPSLTVETLSVYATMPDANGARQVTVSFRIVNHGTTPTAAGSTTVQLAGGLITLATPRLMPGATAFFATTTATSMTDFTIVVTAPNDAIFATATTTSTSATDSTAVVTALNSGTASYHFLADLPTLGRWRPLGPSVIMAGRGGSPEGVGRITTIALDPSSTNTLYAGARASGLWKTSDGGAHWEPLTDALPTVNIVAVTLDATDPKHVLIATPAGIFDSTDGGHVWTLVNPQDLKAQGPDGGAFIVRRLSFIPHFLAAAATTAGPSSPTTTTATQTAFVLPGFLPPLNEMRLYLTTQNGLLISRDGGVNWLPPVLGAGAIIESLDQDRSNLDHMLAAVVNSPALAGVYETFTGGLTPGSWHQLKGCPGAPAPDFSPGAFPANGQIWVTQSGSTQWISDKAPVSDANGNVIGTDHELWRTTSQSCMVNGWPERGWQLLSSGFNTPCISPDSDGRNAEWSYLHADPTNPQIVYKAGIKLCRSTNAGATFQELPVLHDDHHVLVFHPAAPGVLFDGNDGGLYRSGDGGQSWAFDAEGLAVTEFLDMDHGGAAPRVVVGGSQDNELSSSDLTSPIWHLIDLGGSDLDGDRTTAVFDPLDPTVQYSIGQAVAHFSKFENGNRDNSFDTSGLPTGCITYNEVPRAFTEFIATTNTAWHLLMTVGTDNGAPGCNGGLWTGPPWRALFAPADGEVLVRVAYDSSIGLFLAGGNAGSVYINFSPDVMAQVWKAPFGSVTAIVSDPSRTANYFVSLGNGFGAGRIFEISPAGVLHFDGQDITANLPRAVVMTLASNPFESGVLYAGTAGQGVFRGVRNSNGNWTWQPFNNGLPQGAIITKLRMGTDGTLYAATWGRGAFALDTVPNIIF